MNIWTNQLINNAETQNHCLANRFRNLDTGRTFTALQL